MNVEVVIAVPPGVKHDALIADLQSWLRRYGATVTRTGRCSCPVGFGAVRDTRCPVHGRRDPAHTISGEA